MHSEYIQHLNSEPSPDDFVPSSQPWYELNVERSRWFDLFVAEDRIQAMRGVWGVFAYLMRGEDGGKKGGDKEGDKKEVNKEGDNNGGNTEEGDIKGENKEKGEGERDLKIETATPSRK